MTSQRRSLEKEQKKIPVRKKTYQYLKSHIQFGELNSGQRLNQEILAENLEINRPPVREALHRLRWEFEIKAVATVCYLGRQRRFDGLW